MHQRKRWMANRILAFWRGNSRMACEVYCSWWTWWTDEITIFHSINCGH